MAGRGKVLTLVQRKVSTLGQARARCKQQQYKLVVGIYSRG